VLPHHLFRTSRDDLRGCCWLLFARFYICQLYGITMFNKCYKFDKDLKLFQSLPKLFANFSMLWHIFSAQIYCNITSYKINSVVSLAFDFFGFWLIIICKNILEIFHNNDMVEVQTWDPWIKYNVTIILAPFNVASHNVRTYKCVVILTLFEMTNPWPIYIHIW